MRSLAVLRPPAGALLLLAAAAMLVPRSAAAAPPVAPDFGLQRDPVTLRVALDAQQLKDARIHVPAGTRAYRVGEAASPRGAMVAWYRIGDGRLLAAVHLSPRDTHPPTRDGVKLHASAGHQGRAAALFEVATTRELPTLATAAGFAVQPQGAAEHAAAPLLSYRGSTHVVALAPAMDQSLLRAPQFDVRTRDANGALENELRSLSAAGGTPPVLVSGTATQPGVPSQLFALNPGQTPRLLEVEPKPPLRWSAPAQVLPTVLPPNAKTPIGMVVSDVPGAFNLVYRDQPVQDMASGQLANAPLVSDRAGNSLVQVASPAPIQSVQIGQGAGSAASPISSVVSNPPANVSGGSTQLNRIAIAGGVAGVMGVWLVDREGRRQASEVSIVPLEEDMLQRQREWVTIETVESGGEKWLENGQPCECEKVTVKPAFGPDKNPDVTVEATAGGDNDSVMTLTITTNWVATLVCTAGDGECSDTLALSASSSAWRVDNNNKNNGVPVEGSESFSDSKSPPKKPAKEIKCVGPCGKETTVNFATTYTIKVAKSSGGKIGKGASGGLVTLKVMPGACGGSGWTMVLHLVGKGTDLHVQWVTSDRDGDRSPDGKDKVDDPTPKPKADPKPDPKADPKPKGKK